MRYLKYFENLSTIIEYMKNYNSNNVVLPFSEDEYDSFSYNVNPKKYDKQGGLKFDNFNDLLYNNGNYFKEVTSNYEHLKIIKYIFDWDHNQKFCDLGCGIGSILHFAKKIGYKNPIGVEYQENLKKYHKKMNLDIIYGDLLEMDLNFLKQCNVIYLYRPIYNSKLAKKLLNRVLEAASPNSLIIYNDYEPNNLKVNIGRILKHYDGNREVSNFLRPYNPQYVILK